MPDVLFIKTSSLGDVIHQMPAVTEAQRRCPELRFSWVVEEAFAPLVQLHPAVNRVIPIAMRRWRQAPLASATWRGIAGFIRVMRKEEFTHVIDTQGLLFKSALIARFARGCRHGYDAISIRERAAAPIYDVRHCVDVRLHAVWRNRILTGMALGYSPEGDADFGLPHWPAPRGRPRYGVLLHATARPEKEWPEASWIGLGRALLGHDLLGHDLPGHDLPRRDLPGHRLMLPWGTANERLRSERIAAAVPGAIVPEWRPLQALVPLLAGASFVVGVDTGLLHLATALQVPAVAIFADTDPGLTGPIGQGPIVVLGGKGRVPAVDETTAAALRVMCARETSDV
jgi:heptosyltransferase-1